MGWDARRCSSVWQSWKRRKRIGAHVQGQRIHGQGWEMVRDSPAAPGAPAAPAVARQPPASTGPHQIHRPHPTQQKGAEKKVSCHAEMKALRADLGLALALDSMAILVKIRGRGRGGGIRERVVWWWWMGGRGIRTCARGPCRTGWACSSRSPRSSRRACQRKTQVQNPCQRRCVRALSVAVSARLISDTLFLSHWVR